MPTLSRFYGIIIRMYFRPKEHNPPHIHVIYNEIVFSLSIQNLEVFDGELNPPPRVLAMVKEWVTLHQDELLDMWNTQELHAIEPLV